MFKQLITMAFICTLWPLQALSNDAACIALTLHKEAATEGLLGKKAVLDVLQTRMNESGKTACQIIKEPNQFSWVTKDTKFVATKEQLTTYRFVSKMLPVVKGATHFHTSYSNPKWRKHMKFVGRIKHHLFYKENYDRF